MLTTTLGSSNQWCRRRGFKRTPKSFDLSKIWAKSLKNVGKMYENVRKILVILVKLPENIDKNGALRGENPMQTFFGGHPKND